MKSQTIKNYYNTPHAVNVYAKLKESEVDYIKIFKNLKKDKTTLSLGCGSGRELQLLKEKNHEVVGVDFAPNQIKKAKEDYPEYEFYVDGALEFLRKNKHKKFDYILGVSSLLCWIPKKKDRREFVKLCYEMLNKNGEMIFTFEMINKTKKDFVRVIIAPLLAIMYGGYNDFGDAYFNMKGGGRIIQHYFTEAQLHDLFYHWEYDTKEYYMGLWVRVVKRRLLKNVDFNKKYING